MNEQIYMQMVLDTTIKEFTQTLKKNNLLKLEPTVFERTKNAIKKYISALELLNDETIDQDTKKQMALFSMEFQRALKWLKDNISENEFIVFYKYYFENTTKREMAWIMGVDVQTVGRAINNCLRALSSYLFPDYFIEEIFY